VLLSILSLCGFSGALGDLDKSVELMIQGCFLRERQQAGIEEAKKAGVYKGCKLSVPTSKVKAMRDGGHGPSAIAKALGISRISVHRVLTDPRRPWNNRG
jgi:DNA invertase Pin-like site-specific DNA recombinase